MALVRRRRHGVHHVVDAGSDVVQGIGDRGHGIELGTAITQAELRGAAQGNGYDRGVGRSRYRLRPADLVVPKAVFCWALRSVRWGYAQRR